MLVASWFTGWISIGGQIVLTASAAFAAGLQLQALITVNNDSYIPQRWQGMLFYWMIILYSAVVNIWGSKVLPHTNLASGSSSSNREVVGTMLIPCRRTSHCGIHCNYGGARGHGSQA